MSDNLSTIVAAFVLLFIVLCVLLALGYALAWLFGPTVLYVLAIAIGMAGIYNAVFELLWAREKRRNRE